jgi:hypothetical protein
MKAYRRAARVMHTYDWSYRNVVSYKARRKIVNSIKFLALLMVNMKLTHNPKPRKYNIVLCQ